MFVGFGRFGAFSGGIEVALFAAVRGWVWWCMALAFVCLVWVLGFCLCVLAWYKLHWVDASSRYCCWCGILGVGACGFCVLMISERSCLTSSRFLLVLSSFLGLWTLQFTVC